MNPSKRKLSRPGLPGLKQIALLMASCPQSRHLLGECFVAMIKQCNKKSDRQEWVESWSGQRLFAVPPDCSTTELEKRIRHFLQSDQVIRVCRSGDRITFCLVEQRQFVKEHFQGWTCLYQDNHPFHVCCTLFFTRNVRRRLTSLPAGIGQLRALTHLFVDHNDLTSLPDEIGQLGALKCLSCQSNQLVSLPDTIGQCQALTHLFASDNDLTSLPDEIGQLGALTHLSVDHNDLTSLPDEIGQLGALKCLSCQSNQLVSLPDTIGQCQALTHLFASDNDLTSLPDEIGQLRVLLLLDVSNTQVTSLPTGIRQEVVVGCDPSEDVGRGCARSVALIVDGLICVLFFLPFWKSLVMQNNKRNRAT
jgi:hypothetical protein